MDTVHDIIDDYKVFDYDGCLYALDTSNMSRTGIGGDDNVGIFITLQTLRSHRVIKCAFFVDEVLGCVGSQNLDTKMGFFDDVGMVLQCDREGHDGFVDNIYGTKLSSDEFIAAISGTLSTYGRKVTTGGMTDVYQLVEDFLNVSVANMSCGYYLPHTYDEFVESTVVFDTLDMVNEIINKIGKRKWPLVKSKRHVFNSSSDSYWGDAKVEAQKPEDKPDGVNCSCCGGKDTMYDNLAYMYYCFTCDMYS